MVSYLFDNTTQQYTLTIRDVGGNCLNLFEFFIPLPGCPSRLSTHTPRCCIWSLYLIVAVRRWNSSKIVFNKWILLLLDLPLECDGSLEIWQRKSFRASIKLLLQHPRSKDGETNQIAYKSLEPNAALLFWSLRIEFRSTSNTIWMLRRWIQILSRTSVYDVYFLPWTIPLKNCF